MNYNACTDDFIVRLQLDREPYAEPEAYGEYVLRFIGLFISNIPIGLRKRRRWAINKPLQRVYVNSSSRSLEIQQIRTSARHVWSVRILILSCAERYVSMLC